MKSADVLIVEANMTGHRPYYVRLLIEAALATGRRVTVASTSGATGFASEDAALHLAELSGHYAKAHICEATPQRVGELSRAVGAKNTVVPDGDRFAQKLALSRGWNGTGTLSILIMREVAQPTRIKPVRTARTAVRSALFRRANSFPNVRVSVLKSAWWTGKTRFSVARDPVTLRRSAVMEERLRDEWGIHRDRYWFAVLGAISRRKNIDLVAASLSELDASKIGFLVAGGWDESVGLETETAIRRLHDGGASVVVINRRLQDVELDVAVAIVDCLVLAHSNEGPSGLLGKAAAAGTRVVAAGARTLNEDLLRLPGLGAWAKLNRPELTRACAEAVTRGRPERQCDQHTDAFARALL